MSKQKEKVLEDSAESPNAGGSIDLDDAIEKIRRKLASIERSDVLGRYQLALQIKDVRDGSGNRYGLGAMKKLANKISYSEETLRLYAKVTDAWDAAEFKTLASRKDLRNLSATWTLFMIIADAPEEKRLECLTMFFEKGLSAEDIKRSLRSEEIDADANGAAEESLPENGNFPESAAEIPAETEDEASADSDSETLAQTTLSAPKAASKSSASTSPANLRAAIGALQGISGQSRNALSLIVEPLRKAHAQSLDKKLREQIAEARDQLQSNAEAFAALARTLTHFLDAAESAEAPEQTADHAEEEPADQAEPEEALT